MDHYDVFEGVNRCATHFCPMVAAQALDALEKDFPDLLVVDVVRIPEPLILARVNK